MTTRSMQAGPTSKGSFFFFYTNELGFSPEFVGSIQLLDGVAQLAGDPACLVKTFSQG